MIKVCKFGGSSLANSTQFRKIRNIVEADDARKIIVASALGKSDKEDYKVTDLLYLCLAHKKYGMAYDELIEKIAIKHKELSDTLNLDFDVDKEMENLRTMLEHKCTDDEVVSRGEYMSCKALSQYLGAVFVDAKDVICFNYDGSLNPEMTREKFLPYLNTSKKIVVPGFYGSLPNGIIKTMSRGGSDITGSLLANIVDASVYENWTDVSGVFVADPRIVSNPKLVETITYAELREMSYMGANVLHDESIFPVKEKNIPINIRNTNAPDEKGTMIVSTLPKDVKTMTITGITGRKDFEVISITKQNSTNVVGFLSRILAFFDQYSLPIVLLTSSIDSYSVVVDKNSISGNIYELMNEIKTKLSCEEVKIHDRLALVCVVGQGMRSLKGMAGRLFSLLGKNDINIRTIAQGADEISIIVGIDEEDYTKAINCIYGEFVK